LCGALNIWCRRVAANQPGQGIQGIASAQRADRSAACGLILATQRTTGSKLRRLRLQPGKLLVVGLRGDGCLAEQA
jgi:hypothetical protein